MFPSVCSDDWVIDLTENEGTPRARQQTNCPTEYFELCAFRIQFNEINLLNIYFRKVLVKGYNRDSDRLDAVNMSAFSSRTFARPLIRMCVLR